MIDNNVFPLKPLYTDIFYYFWFVFQGYGSEMRPPCASFSLLIKYFIAYEYAQTCTYVFFVLTQKQMIKKGKDEVERLSCVHHMYR